MTPAATHHTFPTTDNIELPGLLYAPQSVTTEIVLWLHGMGDSGVFYSPKRITALASELIKRNVALFAFNNRGAHNSKMLRKAEPEPDKDSQPYQAGTHYELIEDCVSDIDGAVLFLKQLGYRTFHLAGHSTGANKICVYDDLTTNNPFTRYVLAGPGDDIGLTFSDLGPLRFQRALDYAKKQVLAGNLMKIMPKYTGMNPFSAQSAADILDPDGHYNSFPFYEAVHGKLGTKTLFKEYRNITKPMLIIAGNEDEASASAGSTEQALEMLKRNTNDKIIAQTDFQLVPDADHSFHGAENVFAEKVAAWLTK